MATSDEARPGWRMSERLERLEESMCRNAAAGDATEFDGPFELTDMKAWGKERTVRATVLRHLLITDEWPVDAKGVRLRGVRISGLLDLEAATLRCPLCLESCYLDASGPACLNYATASELTVTGCQLAGLTGQMLTARALTLSRSTLTGPLRLAGASVTGPLTCSGAQLTGHDEDGDALSAARIKVGGDVLFDERFTAAGTVDLGSADIAGSLSFGRAGLKSSDRNVYALSAALMKVGEDVLLDEGFTAAGAIDLGSADIAGSLSCSGAQLTGHDEDGDALSASGIKVGGDVLFDEGFTAAATVDLESADIAGSLSFGPAQLKSSDRNVYALSAALMRVGEDVLLGKGFTAAGAIDLESADIAGSLSCSGAQLTGHDEARYALSASGIKVSGDVFLGQGFTAAGTVDLGSADIAGSLRCGRAGLKSSDRNVYALSAALMKVGEDVLLGKGFTAAGAIELGSADIAGSLSCSGAQLTGRDEDGEALSASGIKVGGDVFLDEVHTAAGGIGLESADIAGSLSCSSAQLTGRDEDGDALSASWIKVGEDVFLDEVHTAAGGIGLESADIAGSLSCSGAQLTGRDKDGYALSASGIKVGDDVQLDEGFTAAAGISLASARLSGSLVVIPTRLAGNKEDADNRQEVSLDASRAQVAGQLRWAPAQQVNGHVNLQGAAVGELADDWSGERFNGYWPTARRLRLDGFTYDRFGTDQQATVEEKATVEQRLRWIRSQYDPRAGDSPADFATQPYEQLAAVYRKAGQDADARKVAIARRADLRAYGNLNPYRWLGNLFLDKTIKYGYQTWRAGLGLAAVFVIFLVFSFLAPQYHLMVPVGDTEGLHYLPSATRCTNSYPCFYPFGYAIDTVIPVINVHQAAYWGPDGHAPWGHVWVAGTWVATGLGWALVTLLVAGYTGLVRQQ